MAELAKSFITVTDESAYGAGNRTVVPLYVFATESNKVLDSTTGEIAPGTVMANELLVMTSQKDVINTFGVPSFEIINGTVQQGSELNEVGLLGLYSAMGSSALGYALRADIDLKQLQPSTKEPRSNPKNGTKWFDVKSSSFAVYRRKTTTSQISLKNWEKVDVQLSEGIPTYNEEIDEAGDIVFALEDMSFYECIKTGVTAWYKIGTAAWASKIGNNPEVIFASHMNVPETDKSGSIWIQTTVANDGTKLVKKTYNASVGSWISSIMSPIFLNNEEALESKTIDVGSNAVICGSYNDSEKLATIVIKELKKNPETKEKYLEIDENIKVSLSEPTDEPKDGVLWFDNSIKVDIMINNGVNWVGLKQMYSDANLYIQSEEPTSATDMSIWVDTNDTTYPTIYRYFDGMWNICDNSDQTTVMGVIFGDARYYADDEEPTYKVEEGIVESNLLRTSKVDPDCPDPTSYPKDMLLFNTRFSSNNVKEYKKDAFEGLYDENFKYKVGTTTFTLDPEKLARWKTVSGNDYDGSGLFGSKAQRKVVVDALNGAINSCDELRSTGYDFFFATCPGYPEVDVSLNALNEDKKEMFYIVSDTPKNLKPTVRSITDWGKGTNGGNHGMDSRIIRSAYMTRQYPPMGLSSNVDGTAVAIPTSIVKMKNLLNLPTGQICAGTQYGVVSNIASTGYISEEDEYAVVSVNEGLGEAIVGQAMNPIMMRRNTGLLFWGENTENNGNTSLSDEHAILTLLRLKRELDEACTPFFFRKNTLATRNDFNYVLRTILNSYVANEELYDYVLDTETPNTTETISRKELHANIAIEIVKGIEFIYIPIRVVNTGTLSEQSLVV